MADPFAGAAQARKTQSGKAATDTRSAGSLARSHFRSLLRTGLSALRARFRTSLRAILNIAGRWQRRHASGVVSAFLTLAAMGSGCSHLTGRPSSEAVALQEALQPIQAKYAPVDHLGLFAVGVDARPDDLALTGMVDRAEARLDVLEAAHRLGIQAADHIKVLPAKELGDRTWGIACLSVSTGREQPEHKAEMGTQVLMGGVVRVLQPNTNSVWYLVETTDGYPAWLEKGTFFRCTFDEVRTWTNSSLLIVTAFESLVRSEPLSDALPVSDVVTADLVRRVGDAGTWYKVELPDHRNGYLPRDAAEDYRAWLSKRVPMPQNIEHTARTFLGRPYLWGGNSPKGFDCSGFTKTVFYLNGIELGRNASHQARQGVSVPLDPDFTRLQCGDLLFFGRPARDGGPERIHHVAVYLGDKLFIHSSERVQVNSLDPDSPIRDELRIRTLLFARRVLNTSKAD